MPREKFVDLFHGGSDEHSCVYRYDYLYVLENQSSIHSEISLCQQRKKGAEVQWKVSPDEKPERAGAAGQYPYPA